MNENKNDCSTENTKEDSSVKTYIICLCIMVLLLQFVRLGIVCGASMEPTFYDKDIIFCVTTKLAKIQHGDVVVAYPDDTKAIEANMIIKRVIGCPGDTIEIKDNKMFVNSVALDEDYIEPSSFMYDISTVTLGDNEYFLCGDNRNRSLDSRDYRVGKITDKEIRWEVKGVFHLVK